MQAARFDTTGEGESVAPSLFILTLRRRDHPLKTLQAPWNPKTRPRDGKERKKQILLLPPDREIGGGRKKLPVFKPHDLRSLLAEAKASQNVDGDDIAVVVAFRRQNVIQMQRLLLCLGVDPSQPNAWEKGFFLLAHYHHGVGQLAWYARRTNKNAVKWAYAQDLELLREVIMLTQDGLSQRRAIAKIAADPEKMRLFPYREQKSRHFPASTQRQRREAALWARFQKLIASAPGRSLLNLFGGAHSGSLGFWERTLRDLDEGRFIAGVGEE